MSDSHKPSATSDISSRQSQSEKGGLRPLAPRLPPSTAAQLAIRNLPPPTGVTPRGPLPCQLCFRVGCRLLTHKEFGGTIQRSNNASPSASTVVANRTDKRFAASYAYGLAQQYVDRDIASSKIDPFYDLPVSANFNTPEMHRLFHDWFTIEAQSLFKIPRPREMVGDPLCSAFLMPAMQDSALCLSILAISAAIVPSRTGLPAKNVTSLTLVGEAIQEMRNRINANPGHISDITIVAATFLWAVNAWLEDGAAMKSHGSSVRAFVENRGGLAKLGMVGAVSQFISWIDLLHSLVFTEPCYFRGMSVPRLPPRVASPKYGSFWASQNISHDVSIDATVSSACRVTCHLMELVEDADVEGPTPATFLNISQGLQHTYATGSILRAKYRHTGTLNECVCLAIGLVKIECFYGGVRINMLTKSNAISLVKAVKATGGPSYWQRNLDLLIWLLSILVILPAEYEDRIWCTELLSQAVISRFALNDDLPTNWKTEYQQCLKSFAWSEHRFSNQFNKLCEIVIQTRGSDTDDEDISQEEEVVDQDTTKPEKRIASATVAGKQPAKR